MILRKRTVRQNANSANSKFCLYVDSIQENNQPGLWVALVVGIVPLAGWLLWWWNDIWYALPVILRRSGSSAKLPPGYMGIPFLGEMLAFLWYFKVLCRPDDYINSKRRKYGDGAGLYRTHLFGTPAIIACNPSANKFVLQTESSFFLEWPSVELTGLTSLVAVQGASHTRVRSFVVRAINQPDALRRIALMVQPRITTTLKLWAQTGTITVLKEAKKVTFANIGKYFASFEPGLTLDTLDELFVGLVKGFRAYPLKFPGTVFYRSLQCRKRAMTIFREEMEKRKRCDASMSKNDLMEGLMQMKDEDGKQLSETEVLDNIVSLVVASYTSTSLAIMWVFYYLAKYPDVLQKLREEHMPITKKLDGDFITYDEISSCKYTSKVVEEIIRLGNIAAFVFRTASKDVEYKGYKIPKGWKVVCWIRYLHTNPENFEDAMCFNPDRWNEPPKPGTYLVFGGGSRICAGNMLARLQVAVFLHHLVVGYRRSDSSAKLPPGYMGILLLGEMLVFLWYFKVLRRPDDYVDSKRRKYGDGAGLYRTHLFGSPAIIVCIPSANKFVLQNESSFFLGWPTVELAGATSLLAAQGASHTRLRSFVTRAVNQPDALRPIALMVQPQVTTALKLWAQKGRIKVYKEAKKVTFANIGRYFASFEAGLVLDTLDELFKGLIDGFRAYPLNFPGTAFHRALQCRKKAMAIFKEQIEKKKKYDASEARSDLMEGLMQMKDEDGKQLSDIEVLDNIIGLVIAGYTSTSLAIMWAFYYLAKYQDVLKRLRDEHIPIAQKLNGDFITYDEISSCQYTSKVVDEIIRLANISAFIFRTAGENVEYKGYKIPKGWKVVCWLRYLHTNPENFEDPMCFNPDRWNEPPKPGTYLVFGGGSRICAGYKLARLQIAIFLHHLVVGYRWELVNPDAGMSYLPHPKPADEVEIDISKL
ncbi:hypothetical protein BUALT_Bualt07G0054500 [Buddleja alternifolia]|uniref:Ent-kaurenoic acid oxidase n=1 Tax=Buddleja alternifolia TaxID=168488 RepID=A0AAV6XCP9_9LAMI|nr:hypothetical protein BUALT_Bualt07G0054500 [Buddleja alternifolia]